MFLDAKLIRVMVGIKCPAVFETMSKESMCLVQGIMFLCLIFLVSCPIFVDKCNGYKLCQTHNQCIYVL